MKAILAGLLLAGVVVSCSVNPKHADEMTIRIDKMNEITQLWAQIREWRGVIGLKLDPAQSSLFSVQEKTVKDSGKVCAENQKVPAVCQDKDTLATHICDNAEFICKIADELGKNDRAQEKCTSAKASCREAKQIVCNCISRPPVEPPASTPAAPAAVPTAMAPMAPTTAPTPIKPVAPKKVAR